MRTSSALVPAVLAAALLSIASATAQSPRLEVYIGLDRHLLGTEIVYLLVDTVTGARARHGDYRYFGTINRGRATRRGSYDRGLRTGIWTFAAYGFDTTRSDRGSVSTLWRSGGVTSGAYEQGLPVGSWRSADSLIASGVAGDEESRSESESSVTYHRGSVVGPLYARHHGTTVFRGNYLLRGSLDSASRLDGPVTLRFRIDGDSIVSVATFRHGLLLADSTRSQTTGRTYDAYDAGVGALDPTTLDSTAMLERGFELVSLNEALARRHAPFYGGDPLDAVRLALARRDHILGGTLDDLVSNHHLFEETPGWDYQRLERERVRTTSIWIRRSQRDAFRAAAERLLLEHAMSIDSLPSMQKGMYSDPSGGLGGETSLVVEAGRARFVLVQQDIHGSYPLEGEVIAAGREGDSLALHVRYEECQGALELMVVGRLESPGAPRDPRFAGRALFVGRGACAENFQRTLPMHVLMR